MASALDVAAYILKQRGKTSTLKLQKLVYYSQAWSLVWDDDPHAPLFKDRIEAWANGPIVPKLFAAHRQQYMVSRIAGGKCSRLTKVQKETVDAVLKDYGSKSTLWLSRLTHSEPPWQNARKGLQPLERGNVEITRASMAAYYSALA
jgi:uncharacterized phage-associated protein